jgi:tight adherence protein C
LVLIVTIGIFLAVSLATLGLCWWLDTRRQSLSRRFQEVIGPAPVKEPAAVRIGKWTDRLLERAGLATRQEEAIAARVAAESGAGAYLILCQAGYRHPAAVQIYWWVRLGTPVVLAALSLALGFSQGLATKPLLFLTAAGGAVGAFLPGAFLALKARKRQEEIVDALPDAMDLLTVCVEAGLGLSAALVRIAEEFRLSGPALSEELEVVNREMVAGKPRTEALRALAERTGVEDIKALVAMLVQTEKLGTSLSQSLRVYSDSLRTRRRQRAEEAAAKTTIKLVFPLVFLLFPALFIVILGPGALQIIRVLFPAATGGQVG